MRETIDPKFAKALYDRYQSGISTAFAQTLRNIFPNQRPRQLISKAGVVGRQMGEELAIMQSPGFAARSRKYSRDEARELKNGTIPPSFYDANGSGLFHKDGLSKFLDFIVESKDYKTNHNLIHNLMEVLKHECRVRPTKAHSEETFPFLVGLSQTNFATALLNTSLTERMNLKKYFVDLDYLVNAPDSEVREERFQEFYKQFNEDEISSYSDTAGTVINMFTRGLFSKEKTINAIMNLQNLMRTYNREAQSLLNEKEQGFTG